MTTAPQFYFCRKLFNDGIQYLREASLSIMAKTYTIWEVPVFGTGPQWGQHFTAAAIAACMWGASPYEALSDNLAVQEMELVATVEDSDLGPFQEVAEFVNKYHLNKNINWKDWASERRVLEQCVANGELGEGKAAKLLVSKLGDRYSRILDSTFYSKLSKYDPVGVGILLAPGKGGKLEVISSPKTGSSAAAKGIQQGDVITAINGHSTSEMSHPFEVIEPSSMSVEPTITFSIEREGKNIGNFELMRSFAGISNPISHKLVTLPQLGDHKLGYLRLLEFNAVAAEKLKEAVEDLKSQGADEYILDLRGNKGGAFQSAISVANLFMNNQPITSIFDGQGERMMFYTGKDGAITSDPLVVWIDGGSASASEVLAGALRDDCRALLVGRKSYGKGIIQAVFGLSDGNALILTVAKYFTPCGSDIHGNGITPDVISSPLFSLLGTSISQDDFELARSLRSSCSPIPLVYDSSIKLVG